MSHRVGRNVFLLIALLVSATLAPVAMAQAGDAKRPGGGAEETTSAGQVMNGELGDADTQTDDGHYSDELEVDFAAGASAVIQLTSPDFDTVLRVTAPNGDVYENDDVVPGENLDSRVDFQTGAGGRFRIEITSYASGAIGSYSLRIGAPGSSGASPSTGSITGSNRGSNLVGRALAGRHGNGRIFGVFVGIDDYGGSNNLDGCVGDAQNMEQAFIRTGAMSASDSIVLTDRAATRDAVKTAIRNLAARVSNHDVFVFFYSGHGGQIAEAVRGNEADGLDETIVLVDGALRDDELDRALDGVNADTTLIALDSCHAGGFARDLDSPRRLALYSSEEDVLSSTAPRYGAGGFLSHFMNEGVRGAAAQNGRVRVGDLVNYVYRQYREHGDEMESHTADGFGTQQNLVVARSARLADVLWSTDARVASR